MVQRGRVPRCTMSPGPRCVASGLECQPEYPRGVSGPTGQHEEMPDLVIPEHKGTGSGVLLAVDDGADAIEQPPAANHNMFVSPRERATGTIARTTSHPMARYRPVDNHRGAAIHAILKATPATASTHTTPNSHHAKRG